MRIISGQWRGRRLQAPQNNTQTRPTMDRTREAVFGMLRARDVLRGVRVMDACAGSGAYGFEALSQGASHATFVDNDPIAQEILSQNATHLMCRPQVRIIKSDAKRVPVNADAPVAILFCDPPYKSDLFTGILHALTQAKWINSDTLLVLEMHRDETPLATVTVDDQRTYGMSSIVLGYLAGAE